MRPIVAGLTFLGVTGIACLYLGAGAAVFLSGDGGAAVAGLSLTPAGKLPSRPDSSVLLAKSYGELPPSFEVNQGQADSQARFLSRGRGYTLFLTGDAAVLP